MIARVLIEAGIKRGFIFRHTLRTSMNACS
jgi:hypothetical protein